MFDPRTFAEFALGAALPFSSFAGLSFAICITLAGDLLHFTSQYLFNSHRFFRSVPFFAEQGGTQPARQLFSIRLTYCSSA